MLILPNQFRRAPLIDPATLNVGQAGGRYNIQSLANLRKDNLDGAAVVGQPVGMVFDTWNPNTLGSDLVTNGAFPTNTTGWTAANSATLSVVAAKLRVTNAGTDTARAYQSVATVVGRVYKVTLDLGANANGARVHVGPSNTGTSSGLFDTSIAAGVTGSYTFYFVASNTTSFLSLRNGTTTTGHFTEWDNVVVKHIAGMHWIQQDPTRRPILRQAAAGWYYLEGDGVDDFMPAPPAIAGFLLPSYICALVKRKDPTASLLYMFGVSKNATNYHLLRTHSGNNALGLLRETAVGQVTVATPDARFPQERMGAIDSLAVVGQLDTNIGRMNPATTANTWTGATTFTDGGPCLFSQTGTGPSPQSTWFADGVWMNSAPTLAQRAGMRAFFNNIAACD